MNISVEEYLIERDYPVSSKGGVYFATLLEEVVYSMSIGEDNEKIKKELPGIARDYFAGFYHVDRSEYFTEMKRFCHSRVSKDGRKNTESIEDKLLRMGREIIKLNNIEVEKPKRKRRRKRK